MVLKTLPNVDIDAGKKFNNQASNEPKEIKRGNVPNLSGTPLCRRLDQKKVGEVGGSQLLLPATKFHSRKVHQKRQKKKKKIYSI